MAFTFHVMTDESGNSARHAIFLKSPLHVLGTSRTAQNLSEAVYFYELALRYRPDYVEAQKRLTQALARKRGQVFTHD